MRFLLQQFYDLPNLATVCELGILTFETWNKFYTDTYLQLVKYNLLTKNNNTSVGNRTFKHQINKNIKNQTNEKKLIKNNVILNNFIKIILYIIE